MKKRILSLFLTFLLVFTALPVNAAETATSYTFSSLKLYKSSSNLNNDVEPLKIAPEFVGTNYKGYSVEVPDYVTSLYARGQLSKETMEASYGHVMFSSAWGWRGGNVSADGIATGSASFSKGYVSIYIGDRTTSEYQVTVNQYTTLKGLLIDGVVDAEFNRDTKTYHAYVDSKAESVSITPTAYKSTYTITANGTAVKSGEAYTQQYNWDADGKMKVDLVVSSEGKISSTYTITLEKMPLTDTPHIMKQPVEADYIVNEETEALSITASASGDLAYQWYKIDTDSNKNGTKIEGATEKTYVPSSKEIGTVYYYCVLTNTGAENNNVAVSETARVTVDPNPTPVAKIVNPGTAMPDDEFDYKWNTGYIYPAGQKADPLKVEATSAVEGGTWSYKWYQPSKAYNNKVSYGTAVGELTEEGFIPNTTAQYARETGNLYGCRVTYTFKGKDYTSWATTGETYTEKNADGTVAGTYDVIGVCVFVKVDSAATPVINTQPVSAEYIVGAPTVNITVIPRVTDAGKITYQWYKNTINSTEGATAIEGATSSGYNLGTIEEPGVNYYYCVITNTLQGHTASVTSEIAKIEAKTIAQLAGGSFKGEGTEENPYLLETAEDFNELKDLVDRGIAFAGIYFKLANNVTISEGWAGIGGLMTGKTSTNKGKYINPFSGILDGNGKTLTFPKGSMPLFKYVRNAEVKNLNIYGEYIADDGLVSEYTVDYGVDGNYNSGNDGGSYTPGCPDTIDITNVTIKSGTTIKENGFIGGAASGANIIRITNCKVESGVKIGWNAETNEPVDNNAVGSFAGGFNGTIINCTSAATVYGKDYVGGLVGSKGQSMGLYEVKNSSFTGEVIATGTMVGGIIGGGYTSSSAPNTPCAIIENCYVTGKVTGADRVGGIFGGEAACVQNWGDAFIRNNHFYGKITATEGTAGGIIGYMHSLDKHNIIENNYFVDNCGAEKGIGSVNEANLDLTSEKYGRDDDPLGADADKLTKAMTTEQFKDKTVLNLLNEHEGSLRNWVQDGTDYPKHSDKPVAYQLAVSGECKTEYVVGDELDLSGLTFVATWSDGTTTEPKLEDITVTGYDKTARGQQTITLAYGAGKAEIQVVVLLPDGEISVNFSIFGDSKHNSDSDKNVHTLTEGNLTTWVEPKNYTVDNNLTVLDLLEMVLKENDMTCVNSSGNYIESITYKGVTLGEFTNGKNSGWMYTLNDIHSDLGVAEQYMNDGDVIVFHYSDDYTKEKDDMNEIIPSDVIKLINAIGDVTLDSESAINAAREAYTTLSDEQRAEVTNYDVLLAAEKALKELKNTSAADVYKETGAYLENLADETAPTVNSIGGEWLVLGLIRSGKEVPAGYYENVVNYVKESINENSQLHRSKSTDNARVILALTAAGYDVTNVGGYNLLEGLTDMNYVQKQGINGPIWALIAFDSHNYEIPAGGDVTREKLIETILAEQLADGGWNIDDEAAMADSDLTGMAIQALAPYYESNEKVKAAVDKALAALSAMQEDTGAFATYGTLTSESTAQVLVALTALGIDPAKDERFIKEGNSMIDGLIAFAVENGGFKHELSGNIDGMATEQGYYALVSYVRMLAGQTSLYDMSDVEIDTTVEDTDSPSKAPTTGDEAPIAMLMTIAALSGLAAVALIRRKRETF